MVSMLVSYIFIGGAATPCCKKPLKSHKDTFQGRATVDTRPRLLTGLSWVTSVVLAKRDIWESALVVGQDIDAGNDLSLLTPRDATPHTTIHAMANIERHPD